MIENEEMLQRTRLTNKKFPTLLERNAFAFFSFVLPPVGGSFVRQTWLRYDHAFFITSVVIRYAFHAFDWYQIPPWRFFSPFFDSRFLVFLHTAAPFVYSNPIIGFRKSITSWPTQFFPSLSLSFLVILVEMSESHVPCPWSLNSVWPNCQRIYWVTIIWSCSPSFVTVSSIASKDRHRPLMCVPTWRRLDKTFWALWPPTWTASRRSYLIQLFLERLVKAWECDRVGRKWYATYARLTRDRVAATASDLVVFMKKVVNIFAIRAIWAYTGIQYVSMCCLGWFKVQYRYVERADSQKGFKNFDSLTSA